MTHHRADAPQTHRADTPRTAELRRAALACIASPHPGEVPDDCPLVVALPAGSGYDLDTFTAVSEITGNTPDFITADYLRSLLRRWAVRQTGTPTRG